MSLYSDHAANIAAGAPSCVLCDVAMLGCVDPLPVCADCIERLRSAEPEAA